MKPTRPALRFWNATSPRLNNLVSDPLEKLRLAPVEVSKDVIHRVERERRAADLQREYGLEDSLAPFRVGSVPYLNAVPLTRGLEDQIVFVPPSKLAEMLRKKELDAALVSVTEVLFNDSYDVLDGIAVASLGEVQSVFLAHRGPVNETREIHCDTASLTSVNLLQVLLAEQGLRPEFKPLESHAAQSLPDYALLIGDPALTFLRAPHDHQIWDLGAAWFELTKLPFVYAIWALRRDLDTSALRRQLREAKDFGLDTLDYIINTRSEFDREFRKDYLSWHIHYHLGGDEKRGLLRFAELLRKHSGREVFSPRFVR
jgi:chorismate dehydratase